MSQLKVDEQSAEPQSVVEASPDPTKNSDVSEENTKKGIAPWLCALTLVGNRLGGGVVGLPFAIMTVGYTTSIVFMIIHSIICYIAFYLLLKAKDFSNRSSLSDLGVYCYGNYSIYFINTLIGIAQLGYPIIFFIVFGDVSGSLIEKILGGSSFFSSRWFTHTFLAVCMLYLILKKEIQQLKYANIFLLCLVSVFLVIFFAHFMASDPHPEEHVNLVKSNFDIPMFAAIPTLISAFGFNPAFFGAYSTLKNKSSKNALCAGGSAILIVFAAYSAVPLIAFRLYGDGVESNLLINISDENGVFPVVLQILFLVIAIMHIPVIFFFGKESVLIMFDEATRHSYTRKPQKIADVEGVLNNSHHKVDNVSHADSAHHSPSDDLEAAHDSHTVHETHQGDHALHNSDQQEESVDREEPDQEAHATHVVVNIIEDSSKSQENIGESAEVGETLDSRFSPNPKEYLNMRSLYYYLITLTCYIVVVLLSIVVGNVKIFFGIIGTTAAAWCIWIGPGTLYIISFHKQKDKKVTNDVILAYIISCVYIAIGFVVFGGLGTAVILNQVTN